MQPITTTLNNISNVETLAGAYFTLDKFKQVLTGLGKTEPDDEPLKISEILQHSDLDFATKCLFGTDLRNLIADIEERRSYRVADRLYPDKNYPPEEKRITDERIEKIRSDSKGLTESEIKDYLHDIITVNRHEAAKNKANELGYPEMFIADEKLMVANRYLGNNELWPSPEIIKVKQDEDKWVASRLIHYFG